MVLNYEAIEIKEINSKKFRKSKKFFITLSVNSRISASRPLTSFSSCSTRFVISVLSCPDISNSPVKLPLIILRPGFDVQVIVQALARSIKHIQNKKYRRNTYDEQQNHEYHWNSD